MHRCAQTSESVNPEKENAVKPVLSQLHELMRSVRDTLPECDDGPLSVTRPVEEWQAIVAEYDALIEERRRDD